jgi:hypothetical protein
VERCSNTRQRNHAMCLECWRRVPQDLQRAVWRAYRARNEPGGWGRHMQALEDAQAFVEHRSPEELFA